MRLEDVTAEIRPRLPWESIDLGCALARAHYGTILKAWLLAIGPLWLVLAVLLWRFPVLFLLAVWWLKPIYDRVPLFVVSRALFGELASLREVLRAWPRLVMQRWWFALVSGRFSPSRSLSLPVAELEGLRGMDYRQRVNLLERNGGEGATHATLVGVVLEGLVACGLVLLVMVMVPGEVSGRWMSSISDFFIFGDMTDISDGLIRLMALVYMVAVMLMEPFYVSAGFALYINSRTLTEGWDIELAFKRLGSRLSQPGKVLSLGLAVMLGWWSMGGIPLNAASGENMHVGGSERMEEVLASEDFTVHHRYVDVPVENGDGNWLSGLLAGSGVPALMAILGTVMFYVLLAAVLGGIFLLVYKNRHVFRRGESSLAGRQKDPVRAVMGMNVSPESLPEDVVAAARGEWQEGRSREALSLLYRAAITWMIHRQSIAIEESDTEGDCLRRVRGLAQAQEVAYFAKLTKLWVMVAYGKKQPQDEQMLEVFEHWPFRMTERERRAV